MIEVNYEHTEEFLRTSNIDYFDICFRRTKYINPSCIESVTPKTIYFDEFMQRHYYHVIMQSGDNFYVKDNPLEGQ